MIFYGTNSSRLKDGQINNVTCPNCENQTSMTYSVFGKYAYIYWIPIFPLGKVNVLECNSCKRTFKLKELPEQIKHKFELEKHRGIPILHFSGLAIIVLAIAFFAYSGSKNKELDAKYIQAPAIGDVYSVLSDTNGQYTTMKVTGVTNDSVFVVYNDYEIDKRSAIYKIDKKENYTVYESGYTKQEILSLYADKTIYEIDRE
ncbi:zinc-ribbon domain-containing protein [Flaviramulus sp. BrNp1-15]|uniref:zinc-ribbon domain-containing protein n=1 Tax=Flaviramulus sp. BrNp1-15 TaxID=2916754 RepID=UPI001EE92E53|nr:zinc-ribbon domain-containing protein [Flaviramulus sp. BrNp1-15]ULC58921.1 zinc-ribbon domain-containing protein [Flaviramulus sp. BrNp1-15]